MAWLDESIRYMDDMGGRHQSMTENGGVSYSTSESAGLDLFFKLVRDVKEDELVGYLSNAWKVSAEDTVKTLLHCRDCRKGKGEKKIVYDALMWLRDNKPRTYVRNLDMFVEMGYVKDLLILAEKAEDKPWLHPYGYVELVCLASKFQNDLDVLLEFYKEILSSLHQYVKIPVEKLEEYASSRKKPGISLVAKWAPSIGKKFDKENLQFGKFMANYLFPSTKEKKVKSQEMYRKVLTRMRSYLKIVERDMCAGRWDQIAFGTVPAKAHKLYRKAFQTHDSVRYEEYLRNVVSGKENMKSAGIHPHELVREYLTKEEREESIECLWQQLRERIEQVGNLESGLSIVDVSGSMEGLPMEVAISLGILTSELCKGAFKNRVITFSKNPSWVVLDGSLHEKIQKVKKAEWGMNTDLEKVFKMILSLAQSFQCTQEQLPKSLFIFSDMQFDHACCNERPIYHEMKELYKEAGYEIPQIIFWNLQADVKGGAFPVTKDENGTACVSGFSGELLRLFMEDGGNISPMMIYKRAIETYRCVIDPSEI